MQSSNWNNQIKSNLALNQIKSFTSLANHPLLVGTGLVGDGYGNSG